MNQYHHPPLSSASNNIRLMRLLPDRNPTAEIRCELYEYPLQDPSARSHLYEALSYVWSDPKEKLPIVINGCQFGVTTNLHAALLHLWNHFMERTLWIDAICISQENQEEKEKQIGFMAVVFSLANHVCCLAWGGRGR